MKAILFNIESTTKDFHPAGKALIYVILACIAASAILLAISLVFNPHVKFSYS